MKTKKGWDKANVDFDEYVKPLDEVDEALYLRMTEIVAPQYCTHEFAQIGEPDFDKDGVYFYSTFSQINGRYYYLGVLPEFKQ